MGFSKTMMQAKPASLPKKKGVSFYLRGVISLALIVFVFYRVGLGSLWNTVTHAKPLFLILSLCITPVLVLLSSWKWQIILRAHRIKVSLMRIFWLYVVGYFFNTVLPTNVGGDVVRAYSLGKSTGKNAQVFSSVFVERFTGLTVLLFMAILAFFIAIKDLWDVGLSLALLFSVLGYFGLLILVLTPALLHWAKKKIRFKIAQKIISKLEKFQTAILDLREERKTLIFAMANSFLFYLTAVINVYISSLAFNARLSFTDALIITPIVMVVTMIPISIGGIGLAESAYVFTFSRFGLPEAVALSVALFMRLKALIAGLAGGIYYAATGMKIGPEVSAGRQNYEISTKDVKGQVNYFSGFEDVMRQKKSPLHKYMDIVIGTHKISHLIRYELILLLFGYLPGIMGYSGRQIFYRFLFKSFGKGAAFGRSVSLKHPGKISIGRRCIIDEYCSLSAQGDENSAIILGEEVLLGRSTVLGTRNGVVQIGDFSNIGANCRIGTTSRVRFGTHVLLAANCYIGGAQHRFDRTDIPIMRQGYESKGGVEIEDDVWLGAGVTVLDGVRIGTGCVVGAGSIVTKDLPPYSVAIGIPARVVANRQEKQTNQ